MCCNHVVRARNPAALASSCLSTAISVAKIAIAFALNASLSLRLLIREHEPMTSYNPTRAVHSFGRLPASNSAAQRAKICSFTRLASAEFAASVSMMRLDTSRRAASACFASGISTSPSSAQLELKSTLTPSKVFRIIGKTASGLRLNCLTIFGKRTSFISSSVMSLKTAVNASAVTPAATTFASPLSTTSA